MDKLPYEEILQAINECTEDLDRAESMATNKAQVLIAHLDRVHDMRATRAKRAGEYMGVHRRGNEQVKGAVAVTLPAIRGEHEADNRAEDQYADTGGV